MSDTISRQDAIDALDEIEAEVADGYGYQYAKWREYFVEMPSAQPEPQWIPCSERLPEDYTDVLVWFEYYRYGDYNRLYQMHGIGDYMS